MDHDLTDRDLADSRDLADKVAIVTGAAAGLGLAYAEALADAGVRVAACDRRDDIARLPERLASDCRVWQGDVADPDLVRAVVDGAVSEWGRIDILVNNAGIWGASEASDDLDKTLTDFADIFATNFKGEFLFGRAVMPILIEQGRGGDIVNIATDHMVTCGTPWRRCEDNGCPFGEAPRPTGGGDAMDLYDASKWALNGLLYAWAKSLAPHGVRVNQFCMGATDSLMLRGFHNFAPSDEEVASWMRPEDSAAALIELLREGPQGRNAQNINFCIGRPVALEAPLSHRYVNADQVRVEPAS